MAATPLSEIPLDALKKALRDEFPDIKSSHLTEALAYCLGFRTHAALQAAMAGPEQDRPFALLDTARMRQRLVELGYDDDPEFDFEATISGTPKTAGVVSTMDSHAYTIEYKSIRQKAWRNLMVAAVNAALEQRVLTLRPGDNRYTGRSCTIDFTLPGGLPARADISDAGWDEIAIHAAVNPKGQYVSLTAGFDCGDAVGMAWVERRRGAWLQSATTSFRCRKAMLDQLAGLDVQPQGFGDRGQVIM